MTIGTNRLHKAPFCPQSCTCFSVIQAAHGITDVTYSKSFYRYDPLTCCRNKPLRIKVDISEIRFIIKSKPLKACFRKHQCIELSPSQLGQPRWYIPP